MELSIKGRRFELTLALGAIFIRIGSREAYWNALDVSWRKRASGWTVG